MNKDITTNFFEVIDCGDGEFLDACGLVCVGGNIIERRKLNKENSHLIKAARDMFEALEAIEKTVIENAGAIIFQRSQDAEPVISIEQFEKVVSALNKARGKT